MSLYNQLTIPFYQHNFRDVDTFFLSCVQCHTHMLRPIRSIGMRVATNVQLVSCIECRKGHHFDVSQMCLTFVYMFFPNEPIVKDIVFRKRYFDLPLDEHKKEVDIINTPEHIKNKAIDFFTKYTDLIKLLDQ